MRRLYALLPLIGLVVLLTPATVDAQDAGKAAFLEKKCNVCHTVESQEVEKTSKMAGPDLSDAGNTVESAEWLKGFLLKENESEAGEHKKSWSGTDEQLDAIVGWVMGLKKS